MWTLEVLREVFLCGIAVSRIDSCLGRFVVARHFRNVEDGLVWAFAGVYGPNRDHFRRWLWEGLVDLMSLWEVPWCIGGDFNVTLFFDERLRVILIGLWWLVLRILLRSRVSWICERKKLGPTICRGLDWIVFWFLRSGNSITRVLCRKSFSGCAWIMHPSFLLVAVRNLVSELLNLKTCGLKRRVLWQKSEVGGTRFSSLGLLVLC
jgi:hypothetical protein